MTSLKSFRAPECQRRTPRRLSSRLSKKSRSQIFKSSWSSALWKMPCQRMREPRKTKASRKMTKKQITDYQLIQRNSLLLLVIRPNKLTRISNISRALKPGRASQITLRALRQSVSQASFHFSAVFISIQMMILSLKCPEQAKIIRNQAEPLLLSTTSKSIPKSK